jgi:hypothetical protein
MASTRRSDANITATNDSNIKPDTSKEVFEKCFSAIADVELDVFPQRRIALVKYVLELNKQG